MVISRVFPVLIGARTTLNLVTCTKSVNFIYSYRTLPTGLIPCMRIRKMATSKEADLNDPKRQIDFNQLIEKKEKKGVLVIDVREQSEINETGKIPGSIHIPLGDVAKALGDMTLDEFRKLYNVDKPSKDTEIIFSCRSGVRSFKALKTGLDLGYKNAANYKGGWLDWAEKCEKL